MVRFKLIKFALPLVALLATAVISPTPAKAEWEPAWQSSDGSVTLWYNDSASKFAVTIEKDGKFGVYFEEGVINAVFDKIEGSSNPNPDDPNNGKGTYKPDVADMIKHMNGAKWTVRVNPENSPLGGKINSNGDGKVPHWNPGDDDGSGGPQGPGDGSSPAERLAAERKAKIQQALEVAARDMEKVGQGMFDGSEGGTEEWTGFNKKNKHTGNTGNDGNDDDDNGGNYKPNAPDGEDLGPKPELVNPPYKGGRNKVKVGKLRTDNTNKNAGNNKTESPKTSNLMSPGLLEGGNGFAFNGPAAAGSRGAVRAAR